MTIVILEHILFWSNSMAEFAEGLPQVKAILASMSQDIGIVDI
jgi:hypothetical protein